MKNKSLVQRFRSVEEMNASPVPERDGDFDRFVRHCARYRAISSRTFPAGVFRYRTIEEAEADRQRAYTSPIWHTP